MLNEDQNYVGDLSSSDRAVLKLVGTLTDEEKSKLKLIDNMNEFMKKSNNIINFVVCVEYVICFVTMYLAIVGSFTSVKYTIVGLLLTGLLFYLIQETRTFLTKFIKHKIKKH